MNVLRSDTSSHEVSSQSSRNSSSVFVKSSLSANDSKIFFLLLSDAVIGRRGGLSATSKNALFPNNGDAGFLEGDSNGVLARLGLNGLPHYDVSSVIVSANEISLDIPYCRYHMQQHSPVIAINATNFVGVTH